jgi:hypothetical protein
MDRRNFLKTVGVTTAVTLFPSIGWTEQFKTGLPALDKILGSFSSGLITIYGTAESGKTALIKTIWKNNPRSTYYDEASLCDKVSSIDDLLLVGHRRAEVDIKKCDETFWLAAEYEKMHQLAFDIQKKQLVGIITKSINRPRKNVGPLSFLSDLCLVMGEDHLLVSKNRYGPTDLRIKVCHECILA